MVRSVSPTTLQIFANSTLDGLTSLAHPGGELAEPQGDDREKLVRIFVRQLLLALKHMHDLRIAHLDLRPETILLEHNRLKLANFGQARRLLRGLITGEIKGSPEFVSPEIVRSYPLTLATDMWSAGTLTYVLLTGTSPFHGDDDAETLANVDRGTFDTSPLAAFSYDAADFIGKLLQEIPAKRLTVDEALQHPWIDDVSVKDVPLAADCLREFKYQHKWLERRVFVQQTPSEQILEAVLAPAIAVAEEAARREHQQRPAEIYDYLRIKPRAPPPVEQVRQPRKEHPPFVDEFGQVIDPAEFDRPPPHFDAGQFDPRFDPRRLPPEARQKDPRREPQQAQQQRQQAPAHRAPLDQFGRPMRPEDVTHLNDPSRRPTSLDDQRFDDVRTMQQFGPVPIDQFGHPIRQPLDPRQQQLQQLEKRKLIPQEKGETPSRAKRDPSKADQQPAEEADLPKIPLRMIRGERREIEEEIANRILSDISEEGSIAGSLASLEDFEIPKELHRSRSSTPKPDSEPSTPTLTPENTVLEGVPPQKKTSSSTTAPTPTTTTTTPIQKQQQQPGRGQGTVIPAKVSYPDAVFAGLPHADLQVLKQAEEDPSIPVGAPLFLEGLHGAELTVDTKEASHGLIKVTSPAMTLSPSQKSPRRSMPGTKSPVMLSPSQEHSMEVLIATKRGKPGFLPPGELAPELDDEDAHMDDRKKKLKPSKHDGDFRDEKDKLEKDKNRRAVDLNDLDKYRPCNVYKDNNADFQRPDYDVDDSPWDSHYQIGPDTYLMAARGPAFNSRVRDYRRELFGDGAPTVRQGFLGVRNRDITVRERRRYTDILRESQQGLQPRSNENATALNKAPSANAIDRIKADIEKVAPSATKRNADGTYAPIFISRLRDVYLNKNREAVFECAVTASPAPKLQWSVHGKALEPTDSRIRIEQANNVARLVIADPAPFDLGEYTCTATNEFGTDKATCRLISGETPSRPGRPECELASDTELFIHWEAPEGPTYLEGITYRLEFRVAGPDDHGAPWVAISDNIDDEAVVVKHLNALGIYQFRVTAKNGFGLGLPSLSSRIVQTHGKGTPKLQIDVLKNEFRLNVVSLPHKSSNQLEGISEESEEESIRTMDVEVAAELDLQTANPSSRFQMAGLLFKGRFSVLREAIDSSAESGAHCVAKIRHPAADAVVEYETLRDGQHENVQRLIAAYNSEGFLYLMCERLYEDVFSRFVFNDYYTEEQVALTMRQVVSALHFLHFRGVAHLDVNPHNIMFQSKRNWVAKLVDFSSAQFLKDAVKPTEFDVKWAAPELHVADTPVTVQSDVWGMGIVTFCLLGGFHPFTSEYDREGDVKENVLHVKCDPNLIPVNASQESLSFVTWALKKSPLRRMRTDEAMSHKFLSSEPSMVRRREAIKYSSSRLRKTAAMTRQNQMGRPVSNELENRFGAK